MLSCFRTYVPFEKTMTISESVIKLESLVERDMELARRIEDMRKNLMKSGKKKYLITVA